MSAAKQIKAQRLTNLVLKHDGNLAAAARVLGVTRQDVQIRMKTPLIKKTMAELLQRARVTDTFLARTIREGCRATKLQLIDTSETGPTGQVIKSEETVEDWIARHKFCCTALMLKGHIKGNGNGNGDTPEGGIHIHHTQVFQNVNINELEKLPYGDCLRSLSDCLSRQRQ